jgi:hypothetical protein
VSAVLGRHGLHLGVSGHALLPRFPSLEHRRRSGRGHVVHHLQVYEDIAQAVTFPFELKGVLNNYSFEFFSYLHIWQSVHKLVAINKNSVCPFATIKGLFYLNNATIQ